MTNTLWSDIKRLQTLAFRRGERCGPLLKEFHACRTHIYSHPHRHLIEKVYSWLLVPFSLWPVDFEGLSKHLLDRIQSGRKFRPEFLLLLRTIDDPPDGKTQDIVAEFEVEVEKGRYERLIKRPEKFEELENKLMQNEELASTWREIKKHHDTKNYQNSRGVIRRRLSQERNFREGWEFNWRDKRKRFNSIFDALCHRHRLYGIEYDKPLLLKISVNPTPHGTMIVIPREWSLDFVRDLDWNAIGRIHRAHGARRQGPKFSPGRIQQQKDALKVKKLWEEASAQGHRGGARYDYVYERMRKDGRTDASWLKRLLRLAKRRGTNA